MTMAPAVAAPGLLAGADEARIAEALRLLTRWESLTCLQHRARTATHEAGHAVAAVLAGEELLSVSIAPSLGVRIAYGTTLLRRVAPATPARPEADRWRAEVELSVLAAGDVAEHIAGLVPHGDHDNEREIALGALALLFVEPRMSDGERVAFLAWISARTRRQLEDQWPWVCRVRDALLARTTITGADVDALRHPSPDDGAPPSPSGPPGPPAHEDNDDAR